MTPSITLRALEPEDIEILYEWENQPEIWTYSLNRSPISRQTLTQYILSSMEQDIYALKQLRLMALNQGEPIGCIDLNDFDPYHLRAEVGMMIAPKHRGKGLGKEIVKALIDYASRMLGIKNLYCDISAQNIPCLKIYQSLGFEHCGTKKNWIRTPEGWEDAYFLQLAL